MRIAPYRWGVSYRPLLFAYANRLGGTRRESNEFAKYELPCLFLPNGKNRRRTDAPFQSPHAHFPVRPGKLLSRYFFYGTIEAACGELRRKDREASYRPLQFAIWQTG